MQHVRAEEALGVEHGELAGDHGAAVAAVDAVGVVAEAAHQGVVGAGHARHRPGAVGDRRGEAEAGHRRDHDVERVLGPAAVGDRVGQRLDHVEEVEDRARVGVREQQRPRVRAPRNGRGGSGWSARRSRSGSSGGR